MVPNLRALRRATCCCRDLRQQEVLLKTWRFFFFFQRSAFGSYGGVPSAAVRRTGVPLFFCSGASRCCFSCRRCCERRWVRGHLITPRLCSLLALLTLLSSSPVSLPLLLATCRFGRPLPPLSTPSSLHPSFHYFSQPAPC